MTSKIACSKNTTQYTINVAKIFARNHARQSFNSKRIQCIESVCMAYINALKWRWFKSFVLEILHFYQFVFYFSSRNASFIHIIIYLHDILFCCYTYGVEIKHLKERKKTGHQLMYIAHVSITREIFLSLGLSFHLGQSHTRSPSHSPSLF